MTNSAFNRHGIERLSPSSLNLWLDSPGLWSLRYLCNMRDETGASMARGKAVEDGMLRVLYGKTGAVEAAQATFDNNMQGELSEEIDAERALIPGMIEQCQRWKPPGQILGSQLKVEYWFEGVSIPVIGYLDFAFEPIDVDLKTTKACPSKPKADHVRQVALYCAARGRKGALLYVTEKRHAFYELDDLAIGAALQELQAAAQSLERFLSRCTGAEDAIRCLPMNRDSFRWSNAASEKLREFQL